MAKKKSASKKTPGKKVTKKVVAAKESSKKKTSEKRKDDQAFNEIQLEIERLKSVTSYLKSGRPSIRIGSGSAKKVSNRGRSSGTSGTGPRFR